MKTTENYLVEGKNPYPKNYSEHENKHRNNDFKENENELIHVILDGLPPTVNHMHINARGRRFRSKECRDYQDYAVAEISRQRAREWPFSGRVALSIVFTVSDKRRWDIDNRVKAVQDCLELAGVIENDSQIDKMEVKRVYGEKAMTELTLSKIF